MNERNAVTKEYMRQNDRFADVCNYYLFHGEPVVRAEDLEERDTTELAVLFKDSKIKGMEKLRDLLKNCVAKTAGGITYLMIGVENQSEVHYAMPVRNMLYDSLRYAEQVNTLASKNRKDRRLRNSAEYLSGLTKEDKMVPVVTITIYWNSGRWDGPRTLHDMFGDVAPQVLENVSDYKLNLIVPEEIIDFKCFRTEFGRLMELFCYAENTEKFETLLQRDPIDEFVLSPEAVRLVNTCLNMNLDVSEGKEDTKMCKALDELIARGEARGESRGEARGEARGTEKTYLSLVRDGLLELTVAAERLGKTPEEFKKLLAE